MESIAFISGEGILNYKKIWKRKTLADKIFAGFISSKRKYINYPLYKFKKERWLLLVNRFQMMGISKRQRVDIVMLRQRYGHKAKVIARKTGLSKTKVLAVLYYYNCCKRKGWRELFFMNITRKNYHIF